MSNERSVSIMNIAVVLYCSVYGRLITHISQILCVRLDCNRFVSMRKAKPRVRGKEEEEEEEKFQ